MLDRVKDIEMKQIEKMLKTEEAKAQDKKAEPALVKDIISQKLYII